VVVAGLLEPQCQGGAGPDCAARVPFQARWHVSEDDRVAPLVELDALGKQGVRVTSSPATVTFRVLASTASGPCRMTSPPGWTSRSAARIRGQELAEAERLDQVVIGAGVERHDAIGLLAVGRDDEDRGIGALPQLAARRNPVGVGKLQVQQHDVRVGPVQGLAAGDDVVHPAFPATGCPAVTEGTGM
jgi:hypothetical protein